MLLLQKIAKVTALKVDRNLAALSNCAMLELH